MSRERTTISTHDELFKELYVPLSEAAINQATPVLMRLKRMKDFVGEQIRGCARLSLGRGVGNNVIPESSTPLEEKVLITDKALWATSALDWQAVVASGTDKGAFIRVTADEIEGTMVFFGLNMSRQLFGTSAGDLGTMDGSAPIDNGGSPNTWSFTISDATWFRPHWEVGMVINFHTDSTRFEITAVVHSTKTITVTRRSGSYDPATECAGTEKIYMQGSKDQELIGLSQIGAASSSTLYNVNVGTGWIAQKKNVNSKPLIPDTLVEGIEMYNNETGDDVSMIVLNPIQYTQIANLMEGKKEYCTIKSRDARYADIGWKGLLLQHRRGEVVLVTDRMCQQASGYGVYEKDWKFYQRPGWGWLDSGGPSGGTRYLKDFNVGERPKYIAHYGGFGEHFHHPGRLLYFYGMEVPDIF